MSKKSITEGNPALNFISSIDAEGQEESPRANNTSKPKKVAQNGNKSHTKTEKKDYRINLALTSTLGEKIKQQAWREHKSINKFIEELIIKQLNN